MDNPLVWALFCVLVLVVLMTMRAYGYKKQKQESRAYQERLKVGDRVILSSGIHGKVLSLENVTARVEIAPDVVVIVERYALALLEKDLDTQ